ncbi:uncharacterized protein LOC127593118 isoform X2 [Hippocampus zosterae]|uniref:uncharacterized protein LOC127593118 isoform X2 n=1 Tax=Hippocampus zosterae TaxID=109293 RepID=UPI00223D5470|nr:uncharacterized protein LOC127593118 isoform X2 [Hippocampus zosterae]
MNLTQHEGPGSAAFLGPEATLSGPRACVDGSTRMGGCCFRPQRPSGSAEERSGLLNDDTKAASPTAHLAGTVGGTCAPQGDNNIRKMTDTVPLKVEDTDVVQLKLPKSDVSEYVVARENGSLLGEAAHVSDKAALEHGITREESLETFLDKSSSSVLPQEVDSQWEYGDRCPASSVPVRKQDGTPQEAQMYADMSDVCRHDDEGDVNSKVANGCTMVTELCLNEDDAPSSAHTQEATMTTMCQEYTSEPSCLVNEGSEDGECSTLISGQDEKGHDARAQPTEAKLGGEEEKRPVHFNDVETLTATPEVTSSLHGTKENQQENIVQHVADDQDGGCPAATENDKNVETMEDEELSEETPQVLREEVGPAEGSLRSSDEDLYRGEGESPNNAQAAPLESSPLEARCSLGPAMDILSYSEREWRGNTAKSALIRKGYKELSQRFASVRQVRGDNYCALRATLFQMLSQTSQVPVWLQEEDDDDDEDDDDVAADLSEMMGQWTFPGEEEAQPDATVRLQSSLEILRNKWHAAARCPSAAERLRLCDAAFRGGEEEAAMLEALKLLMLRRAVRLHAGMRGGRDVPLFCWLLFARDSSDCPRAFLANHLSRVGVSAGLEQVEMCLLGDALHCTLQVYRLYMADTEEFVAYYPAEHKDQWPHISLITEDDRHYNVPVANLDQEDNRETKDEEVTAAAVS